jgi:hypothetical protein
MTRARGQASRSLLNREFPHRVLVRAENVRGRMFDAVDNFHTNRGLPLKTHSLRQDDKWFVVYCFADREAAEAFHLLFGGELLKAQLLH